MKAVILAAGLAKRLRPLTDLTPKCLLDIGGKNLLQRTIENVLQNGINDFIFVTGYRENMIKEYIAKNFPDLNAVFLTNSDYMNNNNSYSLWMTKDYAGEEIILMDSDILFDGQIIKELINSKFQTCLALKKHKLDEEQIKVKAGNSNKVLEISKVVEIEKAIGESIGIEIISGEFLKDMYDILERKIVKENNVNEFYEKTFEEVIEKNDSAKEMYVVDISEYMCMEIDTIEDLENARKNLI